MIFGIVVLLFAVISVGAILAMILSDSAYTAERKRFFCPWKALNVEAQFLPGWRGLAGRRSGKVVRCSAFPNPEAITCRRICEASDPIRRVAARVEVPESVYSNP